MRNKRLLVLLLLTSCLAQPVFGQTTLGKRDCGQWIKRTDSGVLKASHEAWLLGYMAGLNSMPALLTNLTAIIIVFVPFL